MDLFTIVTYVLAFGAGAFVGVLLGRRSSGANNVVNRTQEEWDEWKREFAEWKESKKD